MDFTKAIETLKATAEKAIRAEGDYIGDDGYVYCGKCHTPKEAYANGLGKVPVMCECQRAEAKREQDERDRMAIEHRRELVFPEKNMRKWTFANDDGSNKELTNIANKFVEHFEQFKEKSKGLLLYGNVGRGKTFYAACIANALLDKNYRVCMTNFSKIANEIGGTYEGKQEYIDRLNRGDLLIIDDLFAERKSEYMQEIVFNVIDSRYRSGLPIIVTTNLTKDELTSPTNEYARVIDRLYEMCQPIEVKGANKRITKGRDDSVWAKNLLGIE